MARSDLSYVETRFFPDFAIALCFSKRKYTDKTGQFYLYNLAGF